MMKNTVDEKYLNWVNDARELLRKAQDLFFLPQEKQVMTDAEKLLSKIADFEDVIDESQSQNVTEFNLCYFIKKELKEAIRYLDTIINA